MDRDLSSKSSKMDAAEELSGACEDVVDDVYKTDALGKDVKALEDKIRDLKSRNQEIDGSRTLEEFK